MDQDFLGTLIDSATRQTFQLDLLFKLVLSVILGGLIGLERGYAGKAAGLRTNLLICLGAALFTHLSMTITVAAEGAVSDPTRIAAQIVSGVGFLGAGAILQTRGSVHGLTTAATIWVVAGIGVAVGAGAIVAAIGATFLVLFALFPVGWFERRYPIGRSAEIHDRPDDG